MPFGEETDIYFNRQYQLRIGTDGRFDPPDDSTNFDPDAVIDPFAPGNENLNLGRDPGLFVDHLRCTFSVSRSLEQFPNSAFVEVYNLSREERQKLANEASRWVTERTRVGDINIGVSFPNLTTPGAVGPTGIVDDFEPYTYEAAELINPSVRFAVAYNKNQLAKIIEGDLSQIFTSKIGPDIITGFEIGDGLNSFTEAKINMSFFGGTAWRTVLQELVAATGMEFKHPEWLFGSGGSPGILPDDIYRRGIILFGLVRDQLDVVLGKHNLTWSIQDNQLQILPQDTPIPEPLIIVDKHTGMVGSPFDIHVLADTLRYPRTNKDLRSGVQCTTLLNPLIKPGSRVDVISDTVNGSYLVTKLRHYGDTHGNSWYTDIVGEQLNVE